MFHSQIRLSHLIALSLVMLSACLAFAAEPISFTYRAPQVGQQGSHDMQFTLDLKISLHQAGQTVSSEDQQLSRDQDRQVTVLEVADKKAMKVRVTYAKAWEQMTRGKLNGTPQSQSIEGKSYIVARHGDDLVVTDASGGEVPDEERGRCCQHGRRWPPQSIRHISRRQEDRRGPNHQTSQ